MFPRFVDFQLRIRGRNIFMGYLHQPEMTNEAFDKEGWMKTGDVLRRDDDGFLYVRGKTAGIAIGMRLLISCRLLSLGFDI